MVIRRTKLFGDIAFAKEVADVMAVMCRGFWFVVWCENGDKGERE